ncbi:MOSC domain-containing protein [Cellulomonas sp. P22]|uniref:MOSC domain-containing protein n=1 Tax=Cellulomonas sp. P22 TaxID=3373189 RepID=UPI0037A471F0
MSSLHLFPVKSLRGSSVQVAEVERLGLRGDRRWMVVDEDGRTLTARKHPEMLAVTATPAPGGVVLRTAGREPLVVPEPEGPSDVPVQLSRVGEVTSAGPRADGWLSEVLGRAVRLVWLDDPARRPMSAVHGGHPGDPLSLADTGPLLLTSTASLRQLDEWVAQGVADAADGGGAAGGEAPGPLAMERFRPNVVVDGDLEPFVEDTWARLRIGDVEYRFAERCDRCVLTTIDPETRRKGPEPLRTLARHRREDGKVWFGIRVVPVRAGTIAVGDSVVVPGVPSAR